MHTQTPTNFDQTAYYDGLSDEDKETFYKCIKTGFDNADSGMGCYAMTPTDYTTFAPFFAKAIGDYHKGDPACAEKHENDWDISGVGEGGVLDLQKLGLAEELSMRVRVGRNLTSFPLPGAMTKEDRIKFEVTMAGSFDALKEKFGGTVYSYSPDLGEGVEHPNKIDEEKYNELVAAHVMFKDMAADPYLASAGIASDWPYGRGCWQSEDKKKIVWFGEEDQLRIMVHEEGLPAQRGLQRAQGAARRRRVHRGRRLREGRQHGYVTSCPTNLGTGMRASVHVKIPNLTADGTDAKAKEIAGPLGLSVRGTGGEHTPIGADGTAYISPSARLFIKESAIVQALYDGLILLLDAEKAAAPAEA